MNDQWTAPLTEAGKRFEELAAAVRENADPETLTPARAAFMRAAALARSENPWFTENNIADALLGLARMLRPDAVDRWAAMHGGLPKRHTAKKVGIIAAGNIPMVAFHDVLCANVAGHEAVVKLSAQDQRLLPALFSLLESELEGTFFEVIWQEGRLGAVDAVIATGSNNTARYFEYYFGKHPHIIRKNRNSVAVLSGTESDEELQALGTDIFSYFGMGCRNVSKVYMHESTDLDRFFNALYPYRDIVNHHKYANNYDYYKALWLMNGEDLLDNNFVLLRRTDAIAAPVGVVYFERFEDEATVRQTLAQRSEEIQCTVSQSDVPFGKSQSPELWDYADGVDTMGFLRGL